MSLKNTVKHSYNKQLVTGHFLFITRLILCAKMTNLALKYVHYNRLFANVKEEIKSHFQTFYFHPSCKHGIYSVFHRFRQAKFDNGGLILSSSQFFLFFAPDPPKRSVVCKKLSQSKYQNILFSVIK
jgi:hypothetical protein